MADLSLTPVGNQIKPVPQMSLADIMNVARGAQAYQQAQQMNPLQLQQQQAETALAQQTLQPKISQAEQAAQQASIKTSSDQFKLTGDKYNAGLNILGAYSTDPRVISGDKDQVGEVMEEMRRKMIDRGLTPEEAMMHVSPIATYARNNNFNPDGTSNGALANILQTTVKQAASPSERLGLQTGNLVSGPGGTYLYQPGTGKILQPQGIGSQPAPAAPTVPEGTPEYSRPAQLPYQPRKAGLPIVNPSPSEENDRVAGNAFRQGLLTNQNSVSQNTRNFNEAQQAIMRVAQSAGPESGVWASLKKLWATNTGDPAYQQLAKDLAQVVVHQDKALGAPPTNAGLQANQVATGQMDASGGLVNPSVIGNIIDRMYSNQTNLNMQSNAANAFFNKNGDANMPAFQKMWNANADSKVFQAINIMHDVKDPKERTRQLNEVLGTDPEARRILAEKYQNIRSLTDTGELPKR